MRHPPASMPAPREGAGITRGDLRMKITTTAALVAAFVILSAPAAMAQDAAAGKTAFKKCEACHTVEAGKSKPTGPNLLGVFGRKAGGGGDYKYSDAIQKAAAKGLVWDEKSLDAYIEDPKKFLAGVTGDPKATNKMQFNLKNATERANIIAYLKTVK
jgi:cytochrome c